jgi:hypothetical protein
LHTPPRCQPNDIIWFTETCSSNALRLRPTSQDAERDGDTELATFFPKAQAESRKGAEKVRYLLRKATTLRMTDVSLSASLVLPLGPPPVKSPESPLEVT